MYRGCVILRLGITSSRNLSDEHARRHMGSASAPSRAPTHSPWLCSLGKSHHGLIDKVCVLHALAAIWHARFYNVSVNHICVSVPGSHFQNVNNSMSCITSTRTQSEEHARRPMRSAPAPSGAPAHSPWVGGYNGLYKVIKG